MPKYIPNTQFSDCWSSVGNVTFYHRNGICYFRSKAYSDFAGTAEQLEQAELHKRAIKAWQGLSHKTQMIWRLMASGVASHRPPFGQKNSISGYNLFVSAYHGFYTLGSEHVPSPVPFESFPPFAVEVVSAALAGDDLLLKVSVVVLEYVSASRFWLYGRVQLTAIGKGASSRVPRKSVLSSSSCESLPVELVVPDWRSVWPELAGEGCFLVHGSYVLLDAVTGYRSQRRRWSFKVSL